MLVLHVACLPPLRLFLSQATIFLRRSSKWIIMASSWLNPSVDGDVGCNNPLPIGKLQILASSEFGTPPKPTSKRRRGKNQAATDDAQLQQTSSNAGSHRSLRPQTRTDPESWPLIANKKQKKLSPSWQPRQHQSLLKPLESKQSRSSYVQ